MSFGEVRGRRGCGEITARSRTYLVVHHAADGERGREGALERDREGPAGGAEQRWPQ